MKDDGGTNPDENREGGHAQNNIAARISPPSKGGVASPAGEDGVVVSCTKQT